METLEQALVYLEKAAKIFKSNGLKDLRLTVSTGEIHWQAPYEFTAETGLTLKSALVESLDNSVVNNVE